MMSSTLAGKLCSLVDNGNFEYSLYTSFPKYQKILQKNVTVVQKNLHSKRTSED